MRGLFEIFVSTGEMLTDVQRRCIEDMLGVPVVAEVPYDPDLSRAADSGRRGRSVPRTVERALRRVA